MAEESECSNLGGVKGQCQARPCEVWFLNYFWYHFIFSWCHLIDRARTACSLLCCFKHWEAWRAFIGFLFSMNIEYFPMCLVMGGSMSCSQDGWTPLRSARWILLSPETPVNSKKTSCKWQRKISLFSEAVPGCTSGNLNCTIGTLSIRQPCIVSFLQVYS